tara:strand:+ start:883 stop:1455 length:573 start_codon:yes stop_codon:yes gene_type:complete
MNSQHIIIAACFAVPALLILTIAACRCAWHEGKRAGRTERNEVDARILKELRAANADLCSSGRSLNQRISTERSNAALAMELQQQRHDEELTAAKASTPTITESDLKNVQRMVDMLNHLSLDLRNKNRFKDSKEAANRAGVGQRLIDRLFEERFQARNTPDAQGFITIGNVTEINGKPAAPGGTIKVRKP